MVHYIFARGPRVLLITTQKIALHRFLQVLDCQQPIAAFFGYNQLQLGFKQAKLAYDLSLKQLKRAELDLIYQISQSFFILLSDHERLNIAKISLDNQQEAYDIAQSKYKAGLIREVDALQMEVDLSEAINNHDLAEVEYIAQNASFKEDLRFRSKR